jgi:hypothetical protein
LKSWKALCYTADKEEGGKKEVTMMKKIAVYYRTPEGGLAAGLCYYDDAGSPVVQIPPRRGRCCR